MTAPAQYNTPTCPCGDRDEHIVARRYTADRFAVTAFCDGAVTCFANALPGVPVARPRTAEAWHRERSAMWLFVGEVELYDLDECARLHAACRRVAAKGGGVPELRAELARAEEPRINFVWRVEATDSRGDVTARSMVLDRMRWPGLAVWHEAGRYEVLQMINKLGMDGRVREVAEPSGVSFASQRDLVAFLFSPQGKSMSWRPS